MSKVCLLLVLVAALLAAGCATESGSREYIPGKGWEPVSDSRTPDIGVTQNVRFLPSGRLSDRVVQTQSGAWKESSGLIELIAERGEGARAMR